MPSIRNEELNVINRLIELTLPNNYRIVENQDIIANANKKIEGLTNEKIKFF